MSFQRRDAMDSIMVLERQRFLTELGHRLRLMTTQLDIERRLMENNMRNSHFYLARAMRDASRIQLSEHQPHHSFQKIRIERGCESITCSICLVEFPIDTEAICLPKPCGHVYHEDCIMKWLKRSNTCPLCRHDLSFS